jgi:hypothetical protein
MELVIFTVVMFMSTVLAEHPGWAFLTLLAARCA